MLFDILFIVLITIVSCGYIYFCYRRFKLQKIIEGGIPNNKLRMFWIIVCILLGLSLYGVLYGISILVKSYEGSIPITNQATTGTNTAQNTGNTQGIFVGSGAILPGGAEETGEIESRTTIREKLKYVPVTEKRGSSAQ